MHSLSCPLQFLSIHLPPPHLPPLSLHDALPICSASAVMPRRRASSACRASSSTANCSGAANTCPRSATCSPRGRSSRSEEHTSELQSRSDLVCRLLLEKKKNQQHTAYNFDSCR